MLNGMNFPSQGEVEKYENGRSRYLFIKRSSQKKTFVNEKKFYVPCPYFCFSKFEHCLQIM